jgi:hypothetical protein
MRKIVTTGAALALAALAFTALAFGAAKKEYMLGSKLDPMLDHSKGAPNAKGTFTATLDGRKLTWRLTFTKLSGPAVAAHIHNGGAKVASGAVIVPLCGPCKSGQRGTKTVSEMVAHELQGNGKTYVNVHTAKNPNGEIRGQITNLHQ